MHECCTSERERNEPVEMVCDLVNSLMWKVTDQPSEKQEELLMKCFKFLGSAKDLKSIGDALINYKAALEKKKLDSEIKEEEIEGKEEDLEDLFKL